MDLHYRRLLYETMHMVTCRAGNPERVNDETLLKAVTANENLHSAGLTLRPADIWMLAASDSLDTFDREVLELVPQVKAQPMYPGFPDQVMKMSEAQFRFHQAMHYFSTYGMEFFTGCEVSRGWLPEAEGPERTKADRRLLEDTVLELVPEEEAGKQCLQRLFSRRERLTEPQLELVRLSIPMVPENEYTDIKIAFKENLELVFPLVFENMDGADAVGILHNLCAHTGDVLNNIHLVLKKHRYHLRTSQKRTLVRLLESYPAADLRGNLILSNSKRERNLTVLRHLDYNIYSRSAAHKAAVSALRSDTLRSWEGEAERKLRNHEEDALAFLAGRPGIMVRKLNLLLCLGYSEQDITAHLCANARKLSSQTLVRLLSVVRTATRESILLEEKRELDELAGRYNRRNARLANLAWVYDHQIQGEEERHAGRIRQAEENLERSLSELAAERIEEECGRELASLRESMLSSLASLTFGRKARIAALEDRAGRLDERIAFLRSAILTQRAGGETMARRRQWGTGLVSRLTEEKRRIRERILAEQSEVELLQEMRLQEGGWEEKSAQIREKYDNLLAEASSKAKRLRKEHAAAVEALEQAHAMRLRNLADNFRKEMENAPAATRKLSEQKVREAEAIRKKYELRMRSFSNYPAMKRILMRALHEHFKSISTVLRGKRVYVDDSGFDLGHSLMKVMDKNDASTYVASGFAWKIPEEATSVRFFVYWNDSRRVDVDLHAAAAVPNEGADGLKWFHVGWNGDFRRKGVVHSGDITHSDAAEYIDVCLDSPVQFVTMNIDLFAGRNSFRDVAECFAGLMAVGDEGETVRLYDPANCFFSHDLRQRERFLHYGYINVKERYVRYVGRPDERSFALGIEADPPESFYIEDYLALLFDGQGAVRVSSPEEADLLLSVGKSKQEGAVSLIDSNFFLDE